MYQAFSRFSGRFKGHVCGQENGAGDGLGTRLTHCVAQLHSLINSPSNITLVGFTSGAFGSWILIFSAMNSVVKDGGGQHTLQYGGYLQDALKVFLPRRKAVERLCIVSCKWQCMRSCPTPRPVQYTTTCLYWAVTYVTMQFPPWELVEPNSNRKPVLYYRLLIDHTLETG